MLRKDFISMHEHLQYPDRTKALGVTIPSNAAPMPLLESGYVGNNGNPNNAFDDRINTCYNPGLLRACPRNAISVSSLRAEGEAIQ